MQRLQDLNVQEVVVYLDDLGHIRDLQCNGYDEDGIRTWILLHANHNVRFRYAKVDA